MTTPCFEMTSPQQQYMENRLVQIFSDLIDRPYEPDLPIWTDSARQLMEVVWTVARLHRIVDRDTQRTMTMQRMATIVFRKLHRRLPANIYSVARQSRLTRRPPVLEYYSQLWHDNRTDPSIFIQDVKPLEMPPITSYRGVF